MVNTAAEAACEYKLTLEELVNNNKMQINLLTILAEDYHSYPEAIVETIERQMYTVARDRKLPILYVIDSILKNVNKSRYRECFQRIIVKVFLHAFINGDEKVRAAMYKLRITWGPYFKASTLYNLDMKVNGEDSNWPIVSPRNNGAAAPAPPVAAVPAAVRNGTPTVTPSTSNESTASGGQVHVNPKFLQQQQKAKQPLPPAAAKSTSDATRDPRDPRQAHRPSLTSASSSRTSVAEVKTIPAPKPVKKEPVDVLDAILGTPGVVVKEEPEEPIPPMMKRESAGEKRKPDERALLPDKKKRREGPGPRDEDLRQRGVKKDQKASRGTRFSPAQQATSQEMLVRPLMAQPILPPTPHATPVPGSHAFAVPLQPPVTSSPSFTEFSPLPPTFTPAPGVFSTSMPPPPLMMQQPPHFFPQESKAVISTENAPKLEGIPANNRIFVDGKAHEVFYVEDSAVIERNGLPHRIYFSGPPRNVIIDGHAHLLRFGEIKTVYIDGQPHNLRFGSPSKELYMGNYAFKGQFGGPPIVAVIDNMRHEIRLSGPPPEVKIEPDPAYDLARFMHQIREGRAPIPDVKPATESPIELILRLKRKGLLPSLQPEAKKDDKPRFTPINPRENVAPIPSEHTFDSVERKLAPSTSLKDFNMRLLKIRYQAIVDALHMRQRNACPQCGLRMEISGDKYQRHMDWHVKKNLQTLDRSSTSRPWFSAGKDWLTSEDESMAGPSQPSDKKEATTGSTLGVESAEGINKKCVVCGEDFKEFFDSDEDVWRLSNTVLHDDRAYHVGCVQDATMTEEETMSISISETQISTQNAPESVISDQTLIVEHKLNLVAQSQ